MIAAAAAGAIGGGTLYERGNVAPNCGSEAARDGLAKVLRDRFGLESIFLNDTETVSGGFFANKHECSVDVAEIRGNVDASDMHWRHVQYTVSKSAAGQSSVTAELGGAVPLAPKRTTWQRLAAHFFP